MKRIIFSIGLALITVLNVQAQDEQEQIKGEDIQIMEFSEFPEDVQERFMMGDYEGAEIQEAYVLKGVALEDVLDNESMEIYIGDLPPEKLYVLQLSRDNETGKILYYREDGELYATNDIDL